MALNGRSFFNTNMIDIMGRVASGDGRPVPVSYLYFTKTEKEELLYLMKIGMLKEETYENNYTGTMKKGIVLGDNKELYERIIEVYINLLEVEMEAQEKMEYYTGKIEYDDYIISANGKYEKEVELVLDIIKRSMPDPLQKKKSRELETIIVEILDKRLEGFKPLRNVRIRTENMGYASPDIIVKRANREMDITSPYPDDWIILEIMKRTSENDDRKMMARMGYIRDMVNFDYKGRNKMTTITTRRREKGNETIRAVGSKKDHE